VKALGLVLILLAAAACPKGSDNKKITEPGVKSGDAQRSPTTDNAGSAAIVLPPAPPVPQPPAGLPPLPAGAAAISPEAVALGELLFFDARIASDGKTSCASCHDPAHGYAGGTDKTSAGQLNLRRTPSLVNLAWAKELGWDGRYASFDELLTAHLKGQLAAEGALQATLELPVYRAHLARMNAPAEAAQAAQAAQAAKTALEAFVLTRYEGDAPWDRIEPTSRVPARDKHGGQVDPVVAGYLVFTGKGQCAVCHTPPLYTDFGYHHVTTSAVDDDGRGKIDPTKHGAFRTPSLRGAAARIAFFHDGTQKSLDQVVDWYLAAGHASDPQLDPAIHNIHLSPAERSDLLQFLRALTSTGPVPPKPILP
jgi:cytochrome c peroxidase